MGRITDGLQAHGIMFKNDSHASMDRLECFTNALMVFSSPHETSRGHFKLASEKLMIRAMMMMNGLPPLCVTHCMSKNFY